MFDCGCNGIHRFIHCYNRLIPSIVSIFHQCVCVCVCVSVSVCVCVPFRICDKFCDYTGFMTTIFSIDISVNASVHFYFMTFSFYTFNQYLFLRCNHAFTTTKFSHNVTFLLYCTHSHRCLTRSPPPLSLSLSHTHNSFILYNCM